MQKYDDDNYLDNYLDESNESDTLEEITTDGTIYISHQWIPIETKVTVYRETEKAYFGNVTVHECDDDGRVDVLFEKENTWIPKSMSGNVWWICTVMFEHPGKIANRRFDDYG